MYKCTSSPCRSLSEVGLEAVETFELTKNYPTRQIVIDGIESFLEKARRSINPSILWLVGEWGEGKTAVYYGLLRTRRDVYSIYVVASRIFDHMEKVLEEQHLWAPNAFLIALLNTLKDSYEEYSMLLKELDEVDVSRSLPAILVKLYTYIKDKISGEPLIVVFIDEFEDIISRLASTHGIKLLSAVLEALVEIVNGNVEALSKAGIQGKLHFIIATTSSAERVLETRVEISDIWGRLKRRFTRIEFTRMLGIEVLDHLSKLIDYTYCGRDLGYNHIAEPPTLLNFIQISSIGLPAATERLLNQLSSILSSRGKIKCKGGSEKLSIDNAFDILRILKTVVEGEEEQVLIEDNYLLERKNCIELLRDYIGDKEYIEHLCSLILLSRGGLRVQDLVDIVGSENEARRIITVLEHMGIVHTGKGLRLRSNIVELLNAVRIILADLKEKYLEEIVDVIKASGLWESLELYRLLLDHLVYIGSDGSILFFKPNSRELLRKLYTELGGLDEIIALRLIELSEELYSNLVKEGILEDYGEVIVVDYGLQNRIFFSQEIAALDFISNRDERVRLWRRARAERNPEPFLKGVLVPLLDVLKGYFTGNSKNDLYHVNIWRIDEGYPIASIEIVAGLSERKSFAIREFRVEYVPKLRVDVLVITGNVKPSVLEEYYKLIRSKPLYKRPHIVLVFSTGILHRKIEELRRLLKSIGVALVSYPIKTIDYLRLSALGLFGEERWGQDINTYLNSMLDVLRGSKRGVHGLNVYAYQAYIVTRFEREYGLSGLVGRIDKELEQIGILVPLPRRTIHIGSEELGVSDLYDSARSLRWIVHYPTPIREVSLRKLFQYVTDNVRRHLLFGARYRDVVGLDLESPDELANKLAPLIDYGLLELREDHGDYRITLRLGENKLVKRLVELLEDGDLELEKVLDAYVAKSDSPDIAIGVFFESLRSLNLIGINNGYMTLNASYDKIELKLRELRKLLDEYLEHYKNIHDKLGFIVSGKVRHNPPWNPGYRYTYTPKIVKQVEDTINHVYRILRPNISLELCVELSRKIASAERILGDVIYHKLRGEENLRYHSVIMSFTDKEFRYIVKLLEDNSKKLNDIIGQLYQLLVHHVFEEQVQIENRVVGRIRELIEKIKELYNKVYSLEEYKQAVEDLWSKLPGREFPFYFRNPVYYYNFKLYLLIKLLEEYEDVITIDLSKKLKDRYGISPEIKKIYHDAHELINTINTTMEQLISINEAYKDLRKHLLQLEILVKRYGKELLEQALPQSIVQFSKHKPKRKSFIIDLSSGIQSIREEVNEWRKTIGFTTDEDPSTIIKGLRKLTKDIDELYSHIKKYASIINRLVDDIRKLLTASTMIKDNSISVIISELGNESRRVREVVDELERKQPLGLGRLSLSMLKSILEDIRRELKNNCKLIDEAYSNVIDRLSDLKEVIMSRARSSIDIVERILPSIKGIAERLGGETLNIYNELNELVTTAHRVLDKLKDTSIDSPVFIEALDRAVRVYEQLVRLDIDRIRRRVLEALKNSGLSREEQVIVDVILKAVVEGIDRISLRELLNRASKILDIEDVLKAFYSLIEKGLIDAEITI